MIISQSSQVLPLKVLTFTGKKKKQAVSRVFRVKRLGYSSHNKLRSTAGPYVPIRNTCKGGKQWEEILSSVCPTPSLGGTPDGGTPWHHLSLQGTGRTLTLSGRQEVCTGLCPRPVRWSKEVLVPEGMRFLGSTANSGSSLPVVDNYPHLGCGWESLFSEVLLLWESKVT